MILEARILRWSSDEGGEGWSLYAYAKQLTGLEKKRRGFHNQIEQWLDDSSLVLLITLSLSL